MQPHSLFDLNPEKRGCVRRCTRTRLKRWGHCSGVYGLTNRHGSSSSRLAHCPIASFEFLDTTGVTTVRNSNGMKAAYNPHTGNAAVSQTNQSGVKTTQTSRGGHAKTKNGMGVVTGPNGTTCVKGPNNQGCTKKRQYGLAFTVTSAEAHHKATVVVPYWRTSGLIR